MIKFGGPSIGGAFNIFGNSPLKKKKSKIKTVGATSEADLNKLFNKGEEMGEKLTGISSEEVGKKRAEISSQYEDAVNQPSRGSARISGAGAAAEKALGAQMADQQLTGGLAAAQKMQTRANFAAKAADVRQSEYMDALNKLEAQRRGQATDIAKIMGQRAQIGVASKGTPVVQPSQGLLSSLF